MNELDQKVQAYFDGELPEAEAREVANVLARDPAAVALLQTLRVTRQALSSYEAGVKLPESRDFYWSKIRRQIEAAEESAGSRERVEPVSWMSRFGRWLVPVAGVALLLIAGIVATRGDRDGLGVPDGTPAHRGETALQDTKAFTYSDFSSGTTLVWLSYPADSEGIDEPASSFSEDET